MSAEWVGGRGGTQLIEVRNKPLITCDLDACFRSATGASTCSLVGSSLEPAAGSTSPSASTRPREAFCLKFEATGCSLDFKDALGYVLESKWHFEVALDMFSCILGELGVPFGYPWGPLGLHLGTPGRHLGQLGVYFRHF